MVWVAASLLLAAVISPWFYQAGKWLAGQKELPGLLDWLASACGRAKFGRFFDRALLFSALLLLPLLFRRIRRLRETRPPGSELVPLGWRRACAQALTGCVLAGGILWVLCGFVEWTGAFVDRPSSPGFGRFASKVLLPAAGASLVEEWLFRGVLLGLWLRFARPAAACFGSSLLFAFLHFIKPPPGTVIADPSHPLAGIELLGGVFLNYLDPRFFIGDFISLTAVGLILAWARLRTGALWFSIGLHAGWIMGFKASSLLYRDVPGHPLHPWGVGDSLRSGMLPLLTLIVTAGVCHFVLKRFDVPQPRITVTT